MRHLRIASIVGLFLVALMICGSGDGGVSLGGTQLMGWQDAAFSYGGSGIVNLGNGASGDTTGGTNQLKHFSPASFVARNQTSATTTHTLLTTTATALYRINYSAACTGGAGSTITLTVGWTDPNSHAQTQSFSGLDCATNLNAGNSLPVNALTGTDITIAVSIASSPTYDVAATVEQLTSN